jgi:2-polyprenyl-3-methyl-5-hydroxy-6-metoxy-1,4-benzoquinol methylase
MTENTQSLISEEEYLHYQYLRSTLWNQINCKKINIFSRYYQTKIAQIYKNIIPKDARILELGCRSGNLLNSLEPSVGFGIDFSDEAIHQAQINYPNLTFYLLDAHEIKLPAQKFDYIILSDLINDLWDVQEVLENLIPYCSSDTRIVFNFFSHLWSLPLGLARWLGLAKPMLKQNWLTKYDIENLLNISNFESLRCSSEIIIPVPIPILSNFGNRYLAKIWPFENLALTNLMIARPKNTERMEDPSVSVIIAARNESGHIAELIERIPMMGSGTEIIFVEGNSTDDTFEVIRQEIDKVPHKNCKLIKQTGKGKGNAVRNGFDIATGDILMILDADITVPPEDLTRFFNTIKNNNGEFINGVRLVYPMQEEAMRFLNLIGNKFFSLVFSWLLGQPIRDTLCGTKVLWKKDYEKIAKNRSYFGNFDPFGDFDLLFGAARLNLKIIEIPIRYRARKYGETNISRWRHGWLLLKMVIFAARKIKFI